MPEIKVRPFATSDLGILATRPRGYLLGQRVVQALDQAGPVFVDLGGVLTVDVSAADEAFARPLKAATPAYRDDGGPLVICNASSAAIESIGWALANRDISALCSYPGGLVVLGQLDNYLRETFGWLRAGSGSAQSLAREHGLPLKTVSTRLIHLFRRRVVSREHRSLEFGGACYDYAIPKINGKPA